MAKCFSIIKSLLVIAAALSVIALTSCEKEDAQKQHDPFSDEDQTEIATYDGLEWLQGSLVVTDTKGEVIRRVYGTVLDSSRPDVVSVPVKDYAMAEKIFLG